MQTEKMGLGKSDKKLDIRLLYKHGTGLKKETL